MVRMMVVMVMVAVTMVDCADGVVDTDYVFAGGGVMLLQLMTMVIVMMASALPTRYFPISPPPPSRAHSSRHPRPLLQLPGRFHAYRRNRDAYFAGVEAARGNGRRGDGVAR